MAIKFADKADTERPAKKETGGKTYVAEEPAAANKTVDKPEPATRTPGKPRRTPR